MGLHQTRDLHDERNRMKKPTEKEKSFDIYSSNRKLIYRIDFKNLKKLNIKRANNSINEQLN